MSKQDRDLDKKFGPESNALATFVVGAVALVATLAVMAFTGRNTESREYTSYSTAELVGSAEFIRDMTVARYAPSDIDTYMHYYELTSEVFDTDARRKDYWSMAGNDKPLFELGYSLEVIHADVYYTPAKGSMPARYRAVLELRAEGQSTSDIIDTMYTVTPEGKLGITKTILGGQ